MFDALSHTLYHPSTIAHTAVELLDRVRATTPLVHCLTNSVVTGFTANALLAVGATPAMVDLPGEAGPFASVADAILINLGTPHAAHRDAMLEAVQVARTHGTPWVLDPVAVGTLPIRTALADQLRGEHPTAIRGNASEIMALAGAGSGGRGTDATHSVADAQQAARTLAHSTGGVVAVSGPTDFITDGDRDIYLGNGHRFLTTITGGGCALGAVTAAFLAVHDTPLLAVTGAHMVYTIAAQRAADKAHGPGSFQVAFLDELATVTGDAIVAEAIIS